MLLQQKRRPYQQHELLVHLIGIRRPKRYTLQHTERTIVPIKLESKISQGDLLK